MVENRHIAIFYPAAVCNLNCRYCSIDKNPALIKIDKLLEESFKGDYYIQFLKEIFPNPDQLTRVETWGGEPTLGWHRMHQLFRDIINYYPNFNEIFSSTNMVQPRFLEELTDLLKVFGEFPNRKFKFLLQLSLDGPTEINDGNRGKGVTSAIVKSFERMVSILHEIVPDNVRIVTFFKPTLDGGCIEMLQTKKAVLDYYLFFEGFFHKFKELNKSNNVEISPSIPNTATPGNHTVEMGKKFANLCKICYEIENEPNPFQFYKSIMPYNGNAAKPLCQIDCDGYTCGTCHYTIGLLPNKMISGCHASFVDLIDEYKKKLTTKSYSEKVLDKGMFTKDSMNFFCFPVDKLRDRERQMATYYQPGTTARLVTTKVIIQTLAYAGQVDSIFMEDEMALEAADLLYRNASNCMKDNIGANSSITLMPASLIKLLLNGAYQYISKKEDTNVRGIHK